MPYTVTLSQLPKDQEAKAHTAYMSTRLGDSLLAIYSDASSVQGGTGIGVGLTALDWYLNDEGCLVLGNAAEQLASIPPVRQNLHVA
ncbi:hypothetical protein BU25DRAFT_459803 [Macroventuria anomochaeta]|uniref:Uncharacterized protein n=1 Tax=Macroventuria anomochaeta TaxID=301207 RepID=A0ACB6RYD7_9PLEO|nr:uncharacterized protein BU25DRAFT_459803 [Macroventuria anomochaeta]KAF2626277.1 hypothetical protein BU25DRAFT_459803 [Macroventuria anomochaeta]